MRKGIIAAFLILILVIGIGISGFYGLFSASDELEKITASYYDAELSEEDKALLNRVYEAETAWIASLQLENGAIPMYQGDDGEFSVNPYFADIAALALLDNSSKYAENVRLYMDWHFSHLNTAEEDYNKVDGTIYDYIITIENGKIIKEESKNSYDSTDSYAATFLAVLEKYYEKTEDLEYILLNSADILRVISVMLSTSDKGLTFAKPDYEVKYLMDNCEVYDGINAAISLLELMSHEDSKAESTLKKCEKAARKLKNQAEKLLWSSEGNYYKSGIFKDNSPISDFSWSEFYPCATSQLFAVRHGLIGADTVRANTLYETFCDNFKWEDFEIPSDFCWGANVHTAAIMGDAERVVTYMKNYSEKYMPTHDYPLYNADAARVSMAAFILIDS